MSDYYHALTSRKESLENAHHELDNALSDAFIDRGDEQELQKAKNTVENVLYQTESELEVLNADWGQVEASADGILSELEQAAEMLADAGLIEWDEENYVLSPVLDDEPTALTDARRYIDEALSDWWEVRNAAQEAQDDQASSGGYHGGY